jgi:hypothetical protein
MSENLGTVDPERLRWLIGEFTTWQAVNTARDTRLLHQWAKKYCAEDSPKAPSEEAENSDKSEEE